jgi:AbrB family looped-hinge helix DNA binding protein
MVRYITTVTQKGQITIPVELRRMLGLKRGDKVEFELVNGTVLLQPIGSTLLAGFGSVKPLNRPEDFRKIRREIEEEIADEVMKET